MAPECTICALLLPLLRDNRANARATIAWSLCVGAGRARPEADTTSAWSRSGTSRAVSAGSSPGVKHSGCEEPSALLPPAPRRQATSGGMAPAAATAARFSRLCVARHVNVAAACSRSPMVASSPSMATNGGTASARTISNLKSASHFARRPRPSAACSLVSGAPCRSSSTSEGTANCTAARGTWLSSAAAALQSSKRVPSY
mmetsp:Transcript_104164/g.282998  ORF Transcript_104164/g.282998 Transcript_104164/m.282998 type:complete len:202 (-) Transcript_104164:870-1475(-)